MDRKLFIYCINGISEYLKRVLYRSRFSIKEISEFNPRVAKYLQIRDFSFDVKKTCQNVEECEAFLSSKRNLSFCCIEDDIYPNTLKDNRYSPFGLFFQGQLSQDWNNRLCIVGTRYPINDCIQKAYKFSLECGINSMDVVSGLAIGIDQAAMRGCIDGGSKAYAVLGCGLGVGYPSNSKDLKEQTIDSGGALISQFPPYMRPSKYSFPLRNQVLSLLTPAVVAFQAPKPSGVLITVEYALSSGRDVFVHECGVGLEPQKAGTYSLAFDGAPIVSSVSDFVNGKNIKTVKRIPYESTILLKENNLYRFREAWYIRDDED